MGLKEELEEKAEECDAPEEYIEVAKEIVEGLDDKEWAAELLEEGAEWAETWEDSVTYAKACLDILENDEAAATHLDTGKICAPPLRISWGWQPQLWKWGRKRSLRKSTTLPAPNA